MSEDKIAFLENLKSWEWDPVEANWQLGFQLLKDYFEKNGKLPVSTFITDQGYKLGSWVRVQRGSYRTKKISKDKILLLEQIPIWVWDHGEAQWNNIYEELKKFEQLNQYIPSRTVKTTDGISIGNWCSTQRTNFKIINYLKTK